MSNDDPFGHPPSDRTLVIPNPGARAARPAAAAAQGFSFERVELSALDWNAGLNPLVAAANPCVRFLNGERGYVRCTVTPGTWTSDYVVCEDVTKPGGKVLTRGSFVVEAGTPGVKKA